MPLFASLTAVTLDTHITAADYKQRVTEHNKFLLFYFIPYKCLEHLPQQGV
jgi:hypothetical protein